MIISFSVTFIIKALHLVVTWWWSVEPRHISHYIAQRVSYGMQACRVHANILENQYFSSDKVQKGAGGHVHKAAPVCSSCQSWSLIYCAVVFRCAENEKCIMTSKFYDERFDSD